MQPLMNQRDVVTIARSTTLREAATTMAERRVGSLLVVDEEGQAIGIVTDRDLCTRAVAVNRDPDESTVERAMTFPVRTIPEASAPRVQISAIRKAAARRLPIVDEHGRPTGIVTADDEICWISNVLSRLAETAQAGRFHGPLRPARKLLDDLERHLDVGERVDESDQISCEEMLGAIAKLREGLDGTSEPL